MPGGQAVILANMHRNCSNHDCLDPREANTHSVHNYLSLAISNLPIALAVGYHHRLLTESAPTPVRTITSVTAHVVLSDITKLYGSHTMITDVAMDVPRPRHGDSFDERVAKLRHKLIELLGNN